MKQFQRHFGCPQLHLVTVSSAQSKLPGSSVHGISQARILEWVAISFSIEVVKETQRESQHKPIDNVSRGHGQTEPKKMTPLKIHSWTFLKTMLETQGLVINKCYLLMSSQNPKPKEQCIQQGLSMKNVGIVIIRQKIVHSEDRQVKPRPIWV